MSDADDNSHANEDEDSRTDRDATVTEGTNTADADVAEATDERAEYATLADVRALREDVAAFAEDIEERTIERPALKGELERYVRKRQRRGHARGWGPYLVLLYGTAMTIGAFALLEGGWAILAMVVAWLSTLGLYVLMVLVGLIGGALGLPGRLRDRVGEFRS